MALIMARPIKSKSSDIYRFKVRVPADLRERMRGERLTLPIGDALQTVLAGEFIEVSLRTRDPVEARKRHARADAATRELWDAKRQGPKPLTHEQATALAGVIYRRTVDRFRDDESNSAIYLRDAFEAELVPQCIAIVDEGCNLLAFIRMDGARVLSIESSKRKAMTAATTGLPTGGRTAELAVGLAHATGGRMTNLLGGLPIIIEDQVVGGIGIGSGTGEQDLDIARAALVAFEAAVKRT
jgi:glc operon protein GlcG